MMKWMSYITYCKKTSLGYQVVLKSWAIKKPHISYTTKFAFNTIKNQIVNFCELEIRNVNVLVKNFSLFYPEAIWLLIQKLMCIFIHTEPFKYCHVSCKILSCKLLLWKVYIFEWVYMFWIVNLFNSHFKLVFVQFIIIDSIISLSIWSLKACKIL